MSSNKEGAPSVVVVVVDASREVSLDAVQWARQGLPLTPGDKVFLLGVLHQVNSPMGYKIKVDSNSIIGANQNIIAEEVARKTTEYHENVVEISNQFEAEQIKFQIDIQAGSWKKVAQRIVKKLNPTWIVLDRYMKNDKKYFMENLSCVIFMMKKDNSVEQLKGTKRRVARMTSNVTYDEMIPEIDLGLVSPRSSSSLEKKKSTCHENPRPKAANSDQMKKVSRSSHFQGEGYPTTTGGEQSPFSIPEISGQKPSSSSHTDNSKDCSDQFSDSICSVCNNRRPKSTWKRDFTYSELRAATDGFSPRNFLSEGGFGSVFRGEINGLKIAVKQHKSASFQGEKEFKSEVQVLRKARHDNLVMLLGSCSEGTHRLLVYEYVCNGSLDQHLSKHSCRPLSWEKRMKIAMGAAKGLQYLHANNIIHRDMRPNNILVTHDFEPLLGDFGVARNQHEEGSDHTPDTRVVGTLGYVAPEYAEYGKVSSKTDVYSFGVVLLQLITGRKATDQKLGGKSLVGWARPRLKDRNYPELIDPRIQDSHDVHQLFWMVRVAQQCLCKNPEKRLSMDEVVDALNHIMDNSSIAYDINNLSPTHSNFISPESIESPVDDSIFTVETPSSSTSHHMSGKLPLSPSIIQPFSASNYMYSPPLNKRY